MSENLLPLKSRVFDQLNKSSEQQFNENQLKKRSLKCKEETIIIKLAGEAGKIAMKGNQMGAADTRNGRTRSAAVDGAEVTRTTMVAAIRVETTVTTEEDTMIARGDPPLRTMASTQRNLDMVGTRGKSLTITEEISAVKSQKCHEDKLQVAGESTIDQALAPVRRLVATRTAEEAAEVAVILTIEVEATEGHSAVDRLKAVVIAEVASAAA